MRHRFLPAGQTLPTDAEKFLTPICHEDAVGISQACDDFYLKICKRFGYYEDNHPKPWENNYEEYTVYCRRATHAKDLYVLLNSLRIAKGILDSNCVEVAVPIAYIELDDASRQLLGSARQSRQYV